MTRDFLGRLEVAAEAPDGVKRLRELILNLAVRGALVPQDPSDEPASKLLERIAREKARLVKQGAIKKPKPLPPVSEEEKPFELPEGWEWVRLGSSIELVSGQHLKPEEQCASNLGIPYLTGPADFGDLHPNINRWSSSKKSIAIDRDILITVKGAGVGKINLLNIDECAIGRQLMAIRPILINVFFVYALLNKNIIHFQNASVGSTVPGLSRNDITDLVIAIPPLNEQKRIVARVEALMGLCDRLEAARQRAGETRRAARGACNEICVNLRKGAKAPGGFRADQPL